MKIVLSLDEVRDIIRHSVMGFGFNPFDATSPVRFIHKCSDGSGELDIEEMAQIDRIEIGASTKDEVA